MGVLLSKPNTEKVFEEGSQGGISFAACSMQGWRTSMEDAHVAELDLDSDKSAFFGVYDGHAGTDVAIYTSRFLHKNVAATAAYKSKDYTTALKEGFLKTDADLRKDEGISECSRIRREVARSKQGSDEDDEDDDVDDDAGQLTESGSTAVTVLLAGKDLYCANAGDSRAVISRKGVAVGLSDDHKPFHDVEKARIEKAGGFVEDKRVNGTLAVARAMGDFAFKQETQMTAEEQQVTCDPEIRHFTLEQGDEFIVLACDGIWDMLNNQQVVDLVSERLKKSVPLKEILSDLFDACLSPHPSANEGLGCDNMTAIIVVLPAQQ
jgi:serine/threonine protein phosphatase PrpC